MSPIYIRKDIPWYEPNENTVFYFPLTEDLVDHSWKSVTSTTTGSPTITTFNETKCLQLNWSSAINISTTLSSLDNVFISCWCYCSSTGPWFFWNQPCWVMNGFWMSLPNTSYFRCERYYSASYSQAKDISWNYTNAWHMYSISNWNIYVDWTYWNKFDANSLNGNQPLCIWWHTVNSSCTRQYATWYIADVIMENKSWWRSAQEISDYYNMTKWNYWL